MHSGMCIHFSYYSLHVKRGVASLLFLCTFAFVIPSTGMWYIPTMTPLLKIPLTCLFSAFPSLRRPTQLQAYVSPGKHSHLNLVHTIPSSTTKMGTYAVPYTSCDKQYFGEIGASHIKSQYK